MEEIEIGEYVRTKQGYIAKLEEITDEFMWFDNIIYNNYEETTGLHLTEKYGVYNQKKDIKKHSPNIIDLIEENDAIKFWYEKERICNVYKTSNGNLCVWNGFEDVPIKHIHIKSIVTKEQFTNIEYRLED